MEVRISKIKPNRYNTRENLGDLTGLRASIRKTKGLLQPLIVRRAGENGYELVFGGRRLQALREEGYVVVNVEQRNISNGDMATLALCENVHRKDLTPVELARAYRRGLDATELPVNAFSQVVGESHTKISSYLKILELPDRILEKQERYNTTQLITLGRLNKLSSSVRIMLENVLMQRGVSPQFLRQIAGSCESISAANLPSKTKRNLYGEVVFQDYSHLPPENSQDIRTFSDAVLSKAIIQYNERMGRIKKGKGPKRIKTVKDVTDPNRDLNAVTRTLHQTTTQVQRLKRKGYYENSSRRSQGKFRTAVNKLVTGLEAVLKNE